MKQIIFFQISLSFLYPLITLCYKLENYTRKIILKYAKNSTHSIFFSKNPIIKISIFYCSLKTANSTTQKNLILSHLEITCANNYRLASSHLRRKFANFFLSHFTPAAGLSHASLASFRQENELMMTICICCLSCLSKKERNMLNWKLSSQISNEKFPLYTLFWFFIHNSMWNFSVKKERIFVNGMCTIKIPHLMLAVITRNCIINKIYFSRHYTRRE